jgi:hypothetical protein
VRSYLFDSVALPSIKVTISGFANGLFYVTYKDIRIATALDLEFYRPRQGPYGGYWGWRFKQLNGHFILSVSAKDGRSFIIDHRCFISVHGVYLTAEELGNLFTFIQTQLQ